MINFLTLLILRLKSSIFASTKIGFNLNNKTTSITESQEKLGIIISSPFFKSKDNNEINNASVPTVQTYLEPISFDKFSSNFFTSFPKIKLFLIIVFLNRL